MRLHVQIGIVTIVMAAALLGSARPVCAQLPGGYAASFLNRSMLAGEIARGGAFTPFAADGSAILSNASALSLLRHPSVSLSVSSAPLGQSSAALGFGSNLAEVGGLGIGVLHYRIGDVQGRDELGRRTGMISDQWFAFIAGGSLEIGPASVGSSVRYIREDVGGADAGVNGYAVDLSGSISFRNQLFMAVAINNIAGEMLPKTAGETSLSERIPLDMRFDVSFVYPLDEQTERLRPDPTGIEREAQLRPATYIMALGEIRFLEVGSDILFTLGFEAVPVKFVDLGLRLGFNSAGDVSGGFFYRLPADLLEFSDELRIDLALRRDYEFIDFNGPITGHATVTVGL